MTLAERLRPLALPAVIIVLFVAVSIVRAALDRMASAQEESELLYLPDHQVLHFATLGDDMMAADILWLRGVFYISAQGFEEKQEAAYRHWFIRNEAARPDSISFWDYDFRQHPIVRAMLLWNLGSEDAQRLFRLLDNVVRLDSLFATPYIQGGLDLAIMAGRPEEAMALLSRGEQALPDRWEMPYYKGFLKLFFLNDKRGAVTDISEAARKPGVIPSVVNLAAALQAGMAGVDPTVEFLRSLAETTTDLNLKSYINQQLKHYQGLQANAFKQGNN